MTDMIEEQKLKFAVEIARMAYHIVKEHKEGYPSGHLYKDIERFFTGFNSFERFLTMMKENELFYEKNSLLFTEQQKTKETE